MDWGTELWVSPKTLSSVVMKWECFRRSVRRENSQSVSAEGGGELMHRTASEETGEKLSLAKGMLPLSDR